MLTQLKTARVGGENRGKGRVEGQGYDDHEQEPLMSSVVLNGIGKGVGLSDVIAGRKAMEGHG
ncbi:hypothetical protein HDU96_005459, partial [Phlyctochytrium bullatum]